MNDLSPTIQSFATNLPQAFNHSLARPYLWEFSDKGVILAALELLFYQVLVLLFLFLGTRKKGIVNNFNVFGFLFFLNMAIIIGYTIPNVGAIVRYRSLFWILVLCPVICNIDWSRLRIFIKRAI